MLFLQQTRETGSRKEEIVEWIYGRSVSILFQEPGEWAQDCAGEWAL